ncbi:MAG: capsule biosynthesis protein [Desulfuromonas sp.]|nr:capsule biosynthesis protein [Desulfuromonas sp.]
MKYLNSLRYRLLLFIGIPTALAAFYYGVWASDMYISEAHFSVRSPEGSNGSELLSFFGQAAGSTVTDAHVVQDFIRSADMLQSLEKRFGLRSHYQDPAADFISRLADDATAEDVLEYYRSVMGVSFDPTSGILSVRVRAYSPEMARDVTKAILDESEQLVNRLRDRALQDSLALARSELTVAEQRIVAARESLKQLRRKTDILSPEATAGSVQSLVTGLEAEVAKVRAQLAEARSYMREDSAQVVSLKARLTALERQVAAERGRLTGSGGRGLNEVVGDFERRTLEYEFAQKQYVSALTSLETARIRAESKSRYLVTFASPTLAEDSLYPRRLLYTALAFALFSLLYGITALVIAAIREHVGY